MISISDYLLPDPTRFQQSPNDSVLTKTGKFLIGKSVATTRLWGGMIEQGLSQIIFYTTWAPLSVSSLLVPAAQKVSSISRWQIGADYVVASSFADFFGIRRQNSKETTAPEIASLTEPKKVFVRKISDQKFGRISITTDLERRRIIQVTNDCYENITEAYLKKASLKSPMSWSLASMTRILSTWAIPVAILAVAIFTQWARHSPSFNENINFSQKMNVPGLLKKCGVFSSKKTYTTCCFRYHGIVKNTTLPSLLRAQNIFNCYDPNYSIASKNRKNIFRKMSVMFHPDKNKNSKKAHEIFLIIESANAVLGKLQQFPLAYFSRAF